MPKMRSLFHKCSDSMSAKVLPFPTHTIDYFDCQLYTLLPSLTVPIVNRFECKSHYIHKSILSNQFVSSNKSNKILIQQIFALIFTRLSTLLGM